MTAYKLLDYKSLFKEKIALIYLKTSEDLDSAVRKTVYDFAKNFGGNAFQFYEVANSLSDFDAFHFDNSIVNKILIPEYLPDQPYILNIDAGYIPGNSFVKLILSIEQLIQENNNWIIAAFDNQMMSLPAALKDLNANRLYPEGGVLLFNCQNFHQSNYSKIYKQSYEALKTFLVYAEQELLKITLGDGVIIELPFGGERKLFELTGDVVCNMPPLIKNSELQNSILYKCVGTFKPWKYWVLDPNKKFWLELIAPIEEALNLRENQLIQMQRHNAANEWLPRRILERYTENLYRTSSVPTFSHGNPPSG